MSTTLRWRVAGMLLMVVLAARVGAEPREVRTTVGEDRVLVLLPGEAKGADVVMYHHGAGENAESILTDKLKAGLVRRLVKEGWIVCASDAGGENWGNERAVRAYRALHAWLREEYGVGRTVIFSQSMGGMSGLNLVAQGGLPGLAGWVGIYPVCDVKDMHSRGRFAAAIEKALGKDPAKWANPVEAEPGRFKGVRMRFYASPGDTVVPAATNTARMAERVKGEAAACEVVACEGDHGHPSHFKEEDFVGFVRGCFGGR